MAHARLTPIGRPLDAFCDGRTADRHRQAMSALEAELRERREKVAAGWGEKYRERVHAKGKQTARERLDALKDPGTETFEVGTFVNWGRSFGKLESPGAGVVTAFARVQGRWTMVIANDNTVASGSWWPKTPEKIERAQEMALTPSAAGASTSSTASGLYPARAEQELVRRPQRARATSSR